MLILQVGGLTFEMNKVHLFRNKETKNKKEKQCHQNIVLNIHNITIRTHWPKPLQPRFYIILATTSAALATEKVRVHFSQTF